MIKQFDNERVDRPHTVNLISIDYRWACGMQRYAWPGGESESWAIFGSTRYDWLWLWARKRLQVEHPLVVAGTWFCSLVPWNHLLFHSDMNIFSLSAPYRNRSVRNGIDSKFPGYGYDYINFALIIMFYRTLNHSTYHHWKYNSVTTEYEWILIKCWFMILK